MMRTRWGLVLAIAALTGTVVAATGKITKTGFGALVAGQPAAFAAVGRCPANGATDPVTILVTVKNQNGAVVGQGAGAATGTGPVGVGVTILAGNVNAGDTFTATIEIEQTVGEGDDTTTEGKGS